MAYRDEVEKVIRENEEIRAALEKARADARFTALRQILLAFAFGLSWSILGDNDASASETSAMGRYHEPPWGYGWADITPDEGATFSLDGGPPLRGHLRLALRPGFYRVRFHGEYGDHCSSVNVTDGRTAYARDGFRCR